MTVTFFAFLQQYGLAFIAFAQAVLLGWLGYQQQQRKTKSEENASNIKTLAESEGHFREDLMERIDYLEKRIDSATVERQQIIITSEERISLIRKELQRRVHDMQFEMSTWREKYYTLINDYQRLKLEHTSLRRKLDICAEYIEQFQTSPVVQEAKKRLEQADIAANVSLANTPSKDVSIDTSHDV